MLNRLWVKWIRFGFRLLYNELAWTYDVVSWLVSLGAWRRWQQAALPYVQGGQVLEIGHGPGHMLLALQQAGFSVTGVDLSAAMGRLAQRRGSSFQLVRAPVQSLPFAAAVFDTILATFPTDYVVDPDALRAVRRVLRPNGRFVIVPEGHLRGTSPLHRLIDWLFRITGQRQGTIPDNGPDSPAAVAAWEPLLAPLARAGLATRLVREELPGSSVTIIICTKAPDVSSV